MRWWLFNQCSS